MGTVVYSANLVWAFLGPLSSVLYTSAIGIFGLIAAFRQAKQGRRVQIILGLCGIFLLGFAFITAGFTFVSFAAGPKIVSLRVNDKSIGRRNCGNGSTCADYILAATAGPASYDLIVNSQAYDAVRVNTCYQVTYYQYKSLLDATPDTALYHRINVVSRIETADLAACQ
jgi:hypothetical protein